MQEEEKKENPLPTDDNTQQDSQLNIPSTDQPIPEAEQPIIDNPQPVTEQDMEVHHHSHAHGKKNWKSYFWEFLMLFLAVFCGFLAEYQLEHVIENQREKKYIISFIEDLKADTMKINTVLQASTEQQKGFDTLMGILKQPGFVNDPGIADRYIGNVFILIAFYQTDRTLQQLKNAGGLRLVRKQAASDSIIAYDSMIKEIAEQKDDLYNSNQAAANLAAQIFDFDTPDNTWINRSLVPKPAKQKLLTTDPAKLGEFFNQVAGFKVGSIIYCGMLEQLKANAERQIIFLQNEYHLH